MRLIPQSLFRRNLLLIATLILLGQLAGASIFASFVLKPRAEEFASTIAQNVAAVRQGLAALPADRRAAFIAAFNASQERATQAAPEARTQSPLRRTERLILRYVSSYLAEEGIDAVWRQESPGRLYLRLELDGEPLWLYTPALRADSPLPRAALVTWVLSILLALGGAYLIQRHLSRPLTSLVQAARQLALGERPPPLDERGASEVAALSRGFNHMMQELSRQEQERAIMLAGVSHDLRTPLAKMRLALEMLEGQADQDLLDSMVRSIHHIDATIDQFMDFVRNGESSEERVLTDLPSLLQTCAEHVTPAPELQLQALPLCAIRPRAFARMVDNLLQNAVRYGHAADAPPHITLGCQHHAGHGIEISVADRGPGIPADRVATLMQPFTRGDSARGGPAGSGLGLAIASRIAQLHGSTLELLPRDGGGLLARIRLPATVTSPGPGS